MLSTKDNEILTKVGPDTPMGELMRQYWLPFLLSPELEPDGRVLRIRLLGEDLLAFRDSAAMLALFQPIALTAEPTCSMEMGESRTPRSSRSRSRARRTRAYQRASVTHFSQSPCFSPPLADPLCLGPSAIWLSYGD